MRFKAVVLYNNVCFTLVDRDIDLVWNADSARQVRLAGICVPFFRIKVNLFLFSIVSKYLETRHL